MTKTEGLELVELAKGYGILIDVPVGDVRLKRAKLINGVKDLIVLADFKPEVTKKKEPKRIPPSSVEPPNLDLDTNVETSFD